MRIFPQLDWPNQNIVELTISELILYSIAVQTFLYIFYIV